MSDDRSRSILLQVAFKEAATSGGSIDDIQGLTVQYYTMLTNLHEELGISLSTGGSRGGGDNTPRELPVGTNPFEFQGQGWYDFRRAKENNTVKPNHPDFKTADFKTSEWMVNQQGDANESIAALVAAANAAPFVSA